MYNDDYKFPNFMNSAYFWMKDVADATKIILSTDEIRKFNTNLKLKLTTLYNLDKFNDTISSKILIEHIQSYKLPMKDMYDINGELIHNDYLKKIISNTNLTHMEDYTTIKYGMSIKKTSVRSFPTGNQIFSSIGHSKINNFDRFQETACFPFEPVLIFHQSSDKKWYFVKLYNYFGWVETVDIALATDKKEIFDYAMSEDFLMVIAKETTLTLNEKNSPKIAIKCGMGTRLFYLSNPESNLVQDYIVKFPTRDSSGNLIFKTGILSNNEDVVKGNLPYTRYNIINQALKFIGTPYDWGDKFCGKDCSSFILAIYKCFGILLPRNADQQENSFINNANSLVFNKDDTLNKRCSKIDKLKPGATIFMQGHVMMYLGKYERTHYMVHSFSQYGVKKGASYETRTALLASISTVDLATTSGIPFIQKFTSAVYYE